MPWKEKPFGWGIEQSGSQFLASDATVLALNQVKEVIDSGASIGHVVFETDTIEPPSIDLAIQLMLDSAHSKLRFDRIAASVPSPDPRKSMASDPLWKYRFGKPRAVQVISWGNVFRVCSEVALRRLSCDENWELSRKRSCEFSADQIRPMLEVMVNPPAVEGDFDSPEWLRRIQLTAAQFATSIEIDHGVTIADSRVADVTRGALDWTIDAALVALAQRVKTEPALSNSVCELARSVLARVPAAGSWSCRSVAMGVISVLNSTNGSEK